MKGPFGKYAIWVVIGLLLLLSFNLFQGMGERNPAKSIAFSSS